MIISQFFFHFFLQKFILWSSKWWKQTSYQSCRRCDRLSSTSPKNHWQWSKRTCHWCAVESVILWWFKTNHHRWSSFGPCQYCHYSSFGMGSQWIRKWHTLDHSFKKFIWNPKVWGEEEILRWFHVKSAILECFCIPEFFFEKMWIRSTTHIFLKAPFFPFFSSTCKCIKQKDIDRL